MIVSDEVFGLDGTNDRYVRSILQTAGARAGEVIGVGDLLAAVVVERDPSLERLFRSLLRFPASPGALSAVAQRRLGESPPVNRLPRTRASFSPAALEALDRFETLRHAANGQPEGAVELLLVCILRQLSAEERKEWGILDVDAALALLRARHGLAESDSGRRAPDEPEAEQPAPFSAELGLIEDLTRRALVLSKAEPTLLEGEPEYELLFDRLARALHRPGMNAVLVGERGVGQGLLLAELAARAAFGRFVTLRERRFLLIGCRHTPPEQSRQRLLAILRAAAQQPQAVLCLDGFAALLRGERGATNKGLLLSVLPHVPARLIGLVSPREYEELIADDADMAEVFTAVEAPEPRTPTALRIVGALADGMEIEYAVEIDPEAIHQAVALTDGYILHERLPNKALRVLRDVCEDIAYDRAESASERARVTAEDVVRAVSQASGVPEETLRGVAERGDYEESLGREVLGQEHAVREVATELGLIKAGLTEPGKPASVMLFIGQTGTGKTEMAKTLAQFYSRSKRLRTYTLGNFIEPHSVAGIIGVPPGYVGHEQGGRIVSDLLADPYCVFLLDEADKAHPDVLQPFLNLFDEGWICDQRGVKAYADKAMFILTTNVGQRMLADMAKKGKTPEEMASRMVEALAQIRHTKLNRPVFTPEFLSRIKRVIVFGPLTREAMEGICRKHLRQMQQSWGEKRNKELVVPEPLLQHVADESNRRNEKSEGREGGRIVRKLMAELIESPIQRAATAEPAEYQECRAVVLEARFPQSDGEGAPQAPQITVRFETNKAEQAASQEGAVDHVG